MLPMPAMRRWSSSIVLALVFTPRAMANSSAASSGDDRAGRHLRFEHAAQRFDFGELGHVGGTVTQSRRRRNDSAIFHGRPPLRLPEPAWHPATTFGCFLPAGAHVMDDRSRY